MHVPLANTLAKQEDFLSQVEGIKIGIYGRIYRRFSQLDLIGNSEGIGN